MENDDNEFAELINVLRQQISEIFVQWVDSSWFFSDSVKSWKNICKSYRIMLMRILT